MIQAGGAKSFIRKVVIVEKCTIYVDISAKLESWEKDNVIAVAKGLRNGPVSRTVAPRHVARQVLGPLHFAGPRVVQAVLATR